MKSTGENPQAMNTQILIYNDNQSCQDEHAWMLTFGSKDIANQ